MKPPTPPPSHFGGFVVEIPENFSWLKKVSIKKKSYQLKKITLVVSFPYFPCLPSVSSTPSLLQENLTTGAPMARHVSTPTDPTEAAALASTWGMVKNNILFTMYK